MSNWDIKLGERLLRSAITKKYGGNPQGGISHSAKTPNVNCFSDEDVKVKYGYDFDGWAENNKYFYYTADGQYGDQKWSNGNRAVLNHVSDGRSLRLFTSTGVVGRGSRAKLHMYIGEFKVDEDIPWFNEEALDADLDELRQVIVFRLVPIGEVIVRDEDESIFSKESRRNTGPTEVSEYGTIVSHPEVEEAPIEEHNKRVGKRTGSKSGSFERKEGDLVKHYVSYMEAHGHSLNSYKIKPSTSVRKLRIDLFDKSIKEIIEAKSSARREKVRQALGQVLDYSHIFNMVYPEWEPRQAILLPSKPSEDLVKLLLLYKVSCIYKNSQQLFTRINVDESEIEAHLRV